MRRTRFYVLVTGAMALMLAGASFAVADDGDDDDKGSFKKTRAGMLHGYNEVPAVSSPGSGTFTAEIDADAQKITFDLRYSGLQATAVAAHIHFAQTDVNGGVVAFLCGGGGKPVCPASGTVTGTVVPADVGAGAAAQGIAAGEFAELVAAIRAGRAYVNVHSTTFPGGEIRAQLRGKHKR